MNGDVGWGMQLRHMIYFDVRTGNALTNISSTDYNLLWKDTSSFVPEYRRPFNSNQELVYQADSESSFRVENFLSTITSQSMHKVYP